MLRGLIYIVILPAIASIIAMLVYDLLRHKND